MPLWPGWVLNLLPQASSAVRALPEGAAGPFRGLQSQPRTVVHTPNPNTWKEETGESGVQCQLHSRFEASLDYMRHHLKKPKKRRDTKYAFHEGQVKGSLALSRDFSSRS